MNATRWRPSPSAVQRWCHICEVATREPSCWVCDSSDHLMVGKPLALEVRMSKRPKPGDACPSCKETLLGTLLKHCENPQCRWLRCNECGHEGHPGMQWVRVLPAEDEK